MTEVDRRLIEELVEQGVVDRALIARLEEQSVLDHETIAQLRTALITARRIGAAVGVVMATKQVSEGEAFEMLADRASASERKVAVVAEDVLATGSLEAYPEG